MMKRVARFNKLRGSDGGLPDSPLPECRRKLYAVIGFSSGKAVMVFHFSDNDKAIEVLQKNGVKLIDAKAFGMLDPTDG